MAVGEGSATITAVLDQNPGLIAELEVAVAETGEEIRVLNVVPPSIRQYDTVQIGLSYILDGVGQSFPPPFTWTFSGPDEKDYSVLSFENGRVVSITCNSPSAEPLVMTIRCGNAEKTISTTLIGY